LPQPADAETRFRILIIVRHLPHATLDLTRSAERFALTARQAEVAALLAKGLRNDAIAAALGVTAHTARRHTEAVFASLGVASRAEVAALFASLADVD
jgi:DNA-binding NarL/FixJ family response regulator